MRMVIYRENINVPLQTWVWDSIVILPEADFGRYVDIGGVGGQGFSMNVGLVSGWSLHRSFISFRDHPRYVMQRFRRILLRLYRLSTTFKSINVYPIFGVSYKLLNRTPSSKTVTSRASPPHGGMEGRLRGNDIPLTSAYHKADGIWRAEYSDFEFARRLRMLWIINYFFE